MYSPTSQKKASKGVSAEEALYNLQQIDGLLSSDSEDDQANIAQYLKSDQDLTTVLRHHDEGLRELCDRYVAIHVQEADGICRVYNDFCACDNQLVDFETEIVSFQRKLDEAANDVVMMQQQTNLLVRSITNRRQVSNKINEVYDALQECDAFCEEIANKDVDMNYLANLRELEHKLSFLSKNKALQHSAVDNEIRPKLTAAALKAGDKLQRFLARKISALADNPADLEQQQLMLEQNGQFAYSFLQSYNQPVARELLKLYVRTMADIFYRSFRSLLRDLSEASEIHANPLEPIVSLEELTEVMSNRDSGAPQGNHVAVPPATGFPGRTLVRRDRSVSQHMRGFSDMLTTTTAAAAPLRTLREATFEDTMKAVSSIGVRHGKLQADPAAARQLDQCNSWTWQFAKCIQTLVNTCVAECRFIGNFFCLVDDSTSTGRGSDADGGAGSVSNDMSENFYDSEKIARAVLGKALTAVETSILEDVPMVMERTAVLATLRVIEMAKQFLCTSQDPVPLMLLSGVLEMSKASLRNNLRTALKNDEAALAYLPSVKLCSFRQAEAQRASTTDLLSNRAYAATLGPHPLLLRIGEVLGQLELLNNASFAGAIFSRAEEMSREPSPSANGGGDRATVAASASAAASPSSAAAATMRAAPPPARPAASATAYDPFVSKFVNSALSSLLAFIALLAKRHSSVLAVHVFASVNTYCVLASWTGLAQRFMGAGSTTASMSTTTRRVTIAPGFTKGNCPEGEELPIAAATAAAPAATTTGGGSVPASVLSASYRGSAADGGEPATALSEARVAVLEESLGRHLSAWVDADAEVNGTFAFLFRFVAEATTVLRADFFGPSPPAPPSVALPASLSATATLQLAREFSKTWQERLRTVIASIGKLVQATLGAVAAGRGNQTVVQQRCEELNQRATRVYLQAVADANAKLNSLATTVYGSNSELQTKLVSNVTVLHEVKKSLKA